MDPEAKELLEQNLELSKENNKMLLSLRRSLMWSRIFRVVYWFLILGTVFGVFYYLKPYVEPILQIYSGGEERFQGLNSLLENFQ